MRGARTDSCAVPTMRRHGVLSPRGAEKRLHAVRWLANLPTRPALDTLHAVRQRRLPTRLHRRQLYGVHSRRPDSTTPRTPLTSRRTGDHVLPRPASVLLRRLWRRGHLRASAPSLRLQSMLGTVLRPRTPQVLLPGLRRREFLRTLTPPSVVPRLLAATLLRAQPASNKVQTLHGHTGLRSRQGPLLGLQHRHTTLLPPPRGSAGLQSMRRDRHLRARHAPEQVQNVPTRERKVSWDQQFKRNSPLYFADQLPNFLPQQPPQHKPFRAR